MLTLHHSSACILFLVQELKVCSRDR